MSTAPILPLPTIAPSRTAPSSVWNRSVCACASGDPQRLLGCGSGAVTETGVAVGSGCERGGGVGIFGRTDGVALGCFWPPPPHPAAVTAATDTATSTLANHRQVKRFGATANI